MSNIVTIGGGSGTPVLNEALLLAGAQNICSLVTVMDSGGATGRMRSDSEGREIAYSDGLRTLLSLVRPRQKRTEKFRSLSELLLKRSAKNQLGYTIFSHFFDKDLGFKNIADILENLTGLSFCGQVFPITTASANLVFETKSGRVYRGEHELDDKRMSTDQVAKMWLEPEVTAYSPALNAIREADLIFFACGSLHGSVLVNLLPKGVADTLRHSQATKILLTNLASSRNETHNYSPQDFIKIFSYYSHNPHPLDLMIVPNISRVEFEKKFPKVRASYEMEHSHFLGWDKNELEKFGKSLDITFVPHRATIVDPKKSRLRHDPKKLSIVLKMILNYSKNSHDRS